MRRIALAVVSLVLVAGFSRSAAAAVPIAEAGQARAVIVCAADAIEPEKHAAAELAAFLKQVTGAEFAVAATAGTDRPRLLVGEGAAKLADPGFSLGDLGAEGVVLRTAGQDLILAGGRPRGTLYAVYTFLEDTVGCRWWSSKVSTIPRRPTLAVEALNIRYQPKFEYRESFWFDAFDGDFAVRNKCNGHSERLSAKQGGKHSFEGFVHTFFPLVPPEKYFADHPEWFSEIAGQRKHEGAQLCLTNEEMRRELVKNLRERLRANPAATIASVSQNDWHGNCQCKSCAAIDAEEGSPAGSMIRFVNAVAADIEKDFPHVAIITLAYQYTRKPPKLTRPRPNVMVQLCSIECSFSKPLEDPRNQAFRSDIEGWAKMCDRLYIWDYTTNFAHYVMPHPNLRVLAPNVKFFAANNVKGVFEQGAYQSFGSEMAELRGWVLAKLLWDPSLDGQKLVDAFLDGYYGPAAPHVRAYLQTTHDAVEASGDPLGCFSSPEAKFLSFKTLSAGLQHLKAAEAAAGDDAELKGRVLTAQMPVLYTFILRWDALRKEAQGANAPWPVAETKQAVHERFMELAKAANVTMVAEGRNLEWMKTLLPAK